MIRNVFQSASFGHYALYESIKKHIRMKKTLLKARRVIAEEGFEPTTPRV